MQTNHPIYPEEAWPPLGGPHAGKGPRSYQPNDAKIHDNVSEALMQHPHLDASGIEVSCEEGKVTLNGTVPSRECRDRAEDTSAAIGGVRDVQNNLRVQNLRERTAIDDSGIDEVASWGMQPGPSAGLDY